MTFLHTTEDIQGTEGHTFLEGRNLVSRGLGVDLRPLVCWDCVFESRLEQSVFCECCQVEVFATDLSLFQWSGVCVCVTECYQAQQ
jgi:hypothetical protein